MFLRKKVNICMYVCTYVLCNSAVFTKMPRLSDQGGGGDTFERHLRTYIRISDWGRFNPCTFPRAWQHVEIIVANDFAPVRSFSSRALLPMLVVTIPAWAGRHFPWSNALANLSKPLHIPSRVPGIAHPYPSTIHLSLSRSLFSLEGNTHRKRDNV